MGYSCGDFSFLGGRGNSVIDYCVCSQSFLSFVDDFAVLSKPFSDHMPLNVNLKVFLIIQMSMLYVEDYDGTIETMEDLSSRCSIIDIQAPTSVSTFCY